MKTWPQMDEVIDDERDGSMDDMDGILDDANEQALRDRRLVRPYADSPTAYKQANLIGYTSDCSMPHIASVNQEAYGILPAHYTSIFAALDLEPGVCFNFAIDTLYLR